MSNLFNRRCRSSFASLLAMATLGMGLQGCSVKNSDVWKRLTGEDPSIVSNRPSDFTQFQAVLRLKQAPLLTAIVVNEQGQRVINPEAAASLEAEQQALIAELKGLSSEIKVLNRYRLVVNGIAILAPISLEGKIKGLSTIASVNGVGQFGRPTPLAETLAPANISERTSVKFIGAEAAWAKGIKGQGMSVGIIDTGIDYTHAMMLGAGTAEAYTAVNPDEPNAGYPNAKVVGGIDLVGTKYDAGSAIFEDRIPLPDANPLDEGGHGSHVAGTVAGKGDGINTYDGVAPEAVLHAIKVFGANGSTSDAVVVSALEYAADPNGDLVLNDQLDVVNLSLGSSYGQPHNMYAEAVKQLSDAGTLVVASAGNSSDNPFITGSPAASAEAISVAAGTDDMDINWKFDACLVKTPTAGDIKVEAIQGPISKPVDESDGVAGKFVYIGLAAEDLSEELKAQVNGNVALIDRGQVAFADKVRRAFEAGAVGVVVANNQDGAPFAMGGDGHWEIPAIMITQALGTQLKEEMTRGPVVITFKTNEKFEKPELIDTIAGFSSRGPRSVDALLKPEITAPGSNTISAAMGKGHVGVPFSGTSMAAPHMAGVMALMKQARPGLSSADYKSLVMGTAKTVADATKETYSVSRQGAGRVQIAKALDAQILSSHAAISLGELPIEVSKILRRKVQLRALGGSLTGLTVKWEGSPSIALTSALTATGEGTAELDLSFKISAAQLTGPVNELEGRILILRGQEEVHRLPALAIVDKLANVVVDVLKIHSTSIEDSFGAAVDLKLTNKGKHDSEVLLFNLIGKDARKSDPERSPFLSKNCDLQAAGFRVIQKDLGAGVEPVLQVAVKMYDSMTTWNVCDISVLIDTDGDQIPEQELVGAPQENLQGLSGKSYASILLDAAKTRELRKKYEQGIRNQVAGVTENYTEAILALNPMQAFDSSSIAVVEAPVSALKTRPSGELAVKVLTTFLDSSSVETDDYLDKAQTEWKGIDLDKDAQAYTAIPDSLVLTAGETKVLQLTKGASHDDLMVLVPRNRGSLAGLTADKQLLLPVPSFKAQ